MNEDIFHLGVKALIKNSAGELLLLQVNPAELRGHQGEPYWDIPGGRIHRGDSVEATLRREVTEETGLAVRAMHPFSMVLSPLRIPLKDASDVGLILSAYLCDVEEPVEIRLSTEHINAKWFPPQEAAQLLKVKYPVEFTEKISQRS
ncbi:MAG: NUDIX hydrolase [bacterium]|nr:NUDIX hydrolase [bacterium]